VTAKRRFLNSFPGTKPTYVLQLPQNQDVKTALPLWRAELQRFKKIVEAHTGIEITEDRLRSAIHLMNGKRQARKALMDINQADPAPMRGCQLLEIIFKAGFLADLQNSISLMEEICNAAKKNKLRGDDIKNGRRKRILPTGVPVGVGSDKVVKIVGQCEADVVAFENCSGYKQAFIVDKNKDPMDALAKQYLAPPVR
jgi:benzoyl-CoA reductase/2-hydroxyglutaryl-CoA dehydratase subunit BcrC/BadD/HgdB